MLRKIIQIDEEKCIGCTLCTQACQEGAIGMVDGKARLLREDYCDGLGNCLPACPTGAITFVEKEAPAFDHEAVMEAKKEVPPMACGCPGTQSGALQRKQHAAPQRQAASHEQGSELMQWPVQIKLVPTQAPYYQGANLLVAADCTAFAYAGFHQDFIRNHIAIIGCPKLDEGDYTEKLTEILRNNEIKILKIVRMEVPCCGGLENAAKNALQASGKFIPWQVVTISREGKIVE